MRRALACLLLPAMVLFLVGCEPPEESRETTDTASTTAAGFVGAQVCGECHADQFAAWQGSHHDLAMQPATPDTVLGDFDDARFEHNGVATDLYVRNGQYRVRTDGPDGEPTEYPVLYTFGVDPLQQYLVELRDGRIQTLPVSWDSRAAAAGGQRWFHVYGDDPIDHTDVLHWTRMTQSWESQCADCHSTGLTTAYDIEADRFDTQWQEINVACEACHGQGAAHVAWARDTAEGDPRLSPALNERAGIAWIADETTGNSRRSSPRKTSRELDTCGTCHSRRAKISAEPVIGAPLFDAWLPAMITPPLYHADGQIRDEVYVWGSFLQSRMHEAGVTCSDCHEPHSLQLRAEGADVCLQCHDGGRYQATSHHLHEPSSPGADCLSCHMPATTYMQVDARRDHSFRIPRPQLSIGSDVPNACNGCHADQTPEWAAGVLADAGRLREGGHWSERLAAAWQSPLSRRDLLLGLATDRLAPSIIRASAMSGLQLAGDELAATLVGDWAASKDPMLRWGVARAMQTADAAARIEVLPELLEDPVLAVRIAAASAAAPLGQEALPPSSYAALNAALDDYRTAQRVNPERAEAHVNLGNLNRQLNRNDEAEAAYRTAIRVNPDFVPAYVNLADLYRMQQREADGESLLREGLGSHPEQAALHHALGLLLVRTERIGEATDELRVAADSPQAEPRYALAYALALDAQGKTVPAMEYLQASIDRFGDDPALIAGLANLYQRTGNFEAAQNLAERLH